MLAPLGWGISRTSLQGEYKRPNMGNGMDITWTKHGHYMDKDEISSRETI